MSDQRPDESDLLDRLTKRAHRRAVLKVALSVPPVVMTLRARPVQAQAQTPSSALSGNMSGDMSGTNA